MTDAEVKRCIESSRWGKERALSYWDMVKPTYLENWPPAMHSLSMASIDVPLTVEEARRLGTNIIEFGETFLESGEIQYDVPDIHQRVADAVAKLPNGAFVRLGSRSPKDSWEGSKHGFKTSVGDDPLRFVLDCSERMCEDLSLAIQNNYAPHIWVRQWMTIPRWAEFRCFMRDRQLVGISQYNYLKGESFPEIVSDPDMIQWVIRDNFFPDFRRASHLADVVFDVWVKPSPMRDNTRVWETKLVEINPWIELTDPCLFAWNDGFNGEFRYGKEKP